MRLRHRKLIAGVQYLDEILIGCPARCALLHMGAQFEWGPARPGISLAIVKHDQFLIRRMFARHYATPPADSKAGSNTRRNFLIARKILCLAALGCTPSAWLISSMPKPS